ncbi:MAG TPA: hypothetical protein VFW35_09465 [Sphingomicrobium sp.]|nr:hypothetical protein [Sphingomicrobium sp.]
MATTVKEIVAAFEHLYHAICDRTFSKSLYLDYWSEQELAPLVRTFLLGWFGRDWIDAEQWCELPGCKTQEGRIDFIVDGVAVELAVRHRLGSKSSLSASVNATEMKKLMKWSGKSLLVLFDFSKRPFGRDELTNFRDWPSLGKGPHRKHAVNVAYFYRDGASPAKDPITLNVRVS